MSALAFLDGLEVALTFDEFVSVLIPELSTPATLLAVPETALTLRKGNGLLGVVPLAA